MSLILDSNDSDINVIGTCFHNISINNNIKHNEELLAKFKEAHFNKLISILYQLVNNSSNNVTISLLASIYLKNTVQLNYKRLICTDQVLSNFINEHTIASIVLNVNNNTIRNQLLEMIYTTLTYKTFKKYDDENAYETSLIHKIIELLKSSSSDENLSAIYLTYKLTSYERYSLRRSSSVKDFAAVYTGFTNELVPMIYSLLENNLQKLKSTNDALTSDVTHHLLKIFHYISNFNDPAVNLFNENQFMIKFINIFFEFASLNNVNKSIEKWAISNYAKIVNRYSKTSSLINEDIVNYSLTNIYPLIIEKLFSLITNVLNGTKDALSVKTNYYLITIISRSAKIDSVWNKYVKHHFLQIADVYLIPLLMLNEELLDDFTADPQSFINNIYHNDAYDHDIISGMVNLLMNLKINDPSTLKQICDLCLNKIQTFINSNLELKTDREFLTHEAYVGVVSIMVPYLTKLGIFNSGSDIENVFINQLILPVLNNNVILSSKPWFIARFLNCLSFVEHEFEDLEVLSKLFERCYSLFIIDTEDLDETLVIKVESLSCLRTLIVYNRKIHEHIKTYIPILVEKILIISNTLELEILSSILERIIEDFSAEIQPFAKQLAANLQQKFVKTLENSSENTNDSDIENSEMYTLSLLNAMSTLIMSMPTVDLSEFFLPCVSYIVNNSKIDFMTETLELYQVMILTRMNLTNEFNDDMWAVLSDILNTFDLYAMDYFQEYESTFETLCYYGFMKICNNDINKFQLLNGKYLALMNSYLTEQSDDEFLIGSVLNNLVYYTLGNKNIYSLPHFLQYLVKYINDIQGKGGDSANANGFDDDEDDFDDYFEYDIELLAKGVYSNIATSPEEALMLLIKFQQQNPSVNLLGTTIKSKFYSAFALKLQLLAFMNIFKLKHLFDPQLLQAFFPQMIQINIENIFKLPQALKKKEYLLKADYTDENYEDEDYEDEMGTDLVVHEEDTTKSGIDNINIFVKIAEFFSSLSQDDMAMFQSVVSPDNLTKLQAFLQALQ
ncbi:hypothetical protein QEN19_002135 [Hanseniaspora menglaensis]